MDRARSPGLSAVCGDCRNGNEGGRVMGTDWRSMFDREYLGAWDVAGRDYTLEIVRVTADELTGEGGRKTRKPVLHFKDAKKGLALNKTNSRIIAGMYGNDTRAWIGKRVTLFATTTTFGRE